MTYILTPQSELEAVNEILSSIGSSPVDTLDESLDVDVINAKRLLEATSREVQSKGWYFNTEDSVTLQPDTDSNRVPCPENYLVFYSDGYQLVRQSGYFFDIASRTSEFPNGLTVTLIRYLQFDELPEVFRKYITVRTARLFQMRFLGAQEIDASLQFAESEAYSALVDFELKTGNYNVYNDDTFNSGNIGRS